ncbi:WS/DGAT/MGAT family O-acyltransferase [Mycolicibacterium thermoresistibile]|uniref:Diacylglycerol O-acyltransferase n=2 Tax=Mycolicibacterium thermoresistibile TaxID=1797 RepID=G7CDE9_MYCT3|nr:wax ester/triacylglycerol synthase family O-acyltransferase [Mycolicibacterium thermoresistibile]EHI13973.1 diacylglycerol O-acyltransferase [Mycolicibacterium thermoresistibile ATCC 19527]MCV7187574.1 wax ester/triacylglycerol synthase family O-acyltransferase [Mycolicibacterium thermoresistibile]GAT17192.1 diacylglycerol O-acyltransferase [Mycolicibacterium thermoresistibile]SNW16430.1 diacylglycerol O-acyltransferase [Mycolicibacterium thermoresistibile]
MKRLQGWDAVLLYSETPNVHMHTLKVAVIDLSDVTHPFGLEDFRKVIASRLYKLDPFRYQLVEIPFKFHHPMWRENCEVDLDHHIRGMRVDPPGGRRELDEAVGRIASTPLDRRYPLWEMYFVEGLANGRVAVVGKIHHALADGVASGNLMARGMDLQPGPQRDHTFYRTDPPPGRSHLVRTAFVDHLRQIGRIPSVMRYTYDGLRRVHRSTRKLSPELTRPFTPPPTFLNHKIDATRTFATATLALSDVKATSRHLGVTINDLVLALSAGALRKLLLRYDGHADHPLLASVPVSFDFSPDRICGNYFTGMLVALPVDTAEPLDRIRATRDAALLAKESHQLIGPELISRWSQYLPPAPAERLFGWLSRIDGQNKIQNLTVSNVMGPKERGRVGGALVTEIYSVGPLTAASGLNITVWSYVDQLNISVLSDGSTFDDPHEVTDAMVGEFIEIRGAAGLPGELTVVETAMAR